MSRSDTLLKLLGVTNKRLANVPVQDESSIVIAGLAHVPVLDRHGDTFQMSRFVPDQPFMHGQYRNLMYEHTPLQVGVVVDSYTDKTGRAYRTGAQSSGFYVVAMLRNDAPYMDRIKSDILSGAVACFSIGAVNKGGQLFIHEVSVCRKGANPQATFQIVHK